MYTVNNSIKMLILDTWNNKFHCNIEIKATVRAVALAQS